MKIGDVVKHKGSDQKMVVISTNKENSHISMGYVKCQYLNIVTGIYNNYEFRVEELLSIPE